MAGGSPPGIRPSGKPAGSGRRRGTLDRGARQLLTAELANDILSAYQALGGAAWLAKWAKANQTEFVRQALSRLMPAPDRPDGDSLSISVQTSLLDDRATAMRIAFLLNKGVRTEPHGTLERVADPVVGPVPAAAAPVDSVANPVPDSAPDPVARDSAWQAMLPPTAAERDAQAATQQASDAHHGSAAEQAEPKQPRPGLPNRRSELL